MLTIGKLAAMAGTTPNTLRYYEREGLVPPAIKGDNGYRLYPQDAAQRVHFIRQAQQCGFRLAEIRTLLSIPSQASAGCADVPSSKTRSGSQDQADEGDVGRT